MSEKKKALFADLILGAIITAVVVALRWDKEVTIWHQLCDGFFAAAVALLGIGGLRFVRNKGTFDVMGYSMMTAIHNFLPMTRPDPSRNAREEDFLDYRARKEEGRKSARSLLISGAVYLALSMLCLAVYYSIK